MGTIPISYYIQLESISIKEYASKLQTAYLPPSRMILKEKISERFNYFENIGITNIQELIQYLKKKNTFSELQQVDFFKGDYAKILLRELNSIHPKPNKLEDFNIIKPKSTQALQAIGIKNTLKLFDRVVTADTRKKLSKETGITGNEVIKLAKLTDLSRIKWVGSTFAEMLYELGYDSVEKAAKANAEELHKQIPLLNKEKSKYKANIGLNDIRILVNAAKEVPVCIIF